MNDVVFVEPALVVQIRLLAVGDRTVATGAGVQSGRRATGADLTA
jgi:hypothetical protein